MCSTPSAYWIAAESVPLTCNPEPRETRHSWMVEALASIVIVPSNPCQSGISLGSAAIECRCMALGFSCTSLHVLQQLRRSFEPFDMCKLWLAQQDVLPEACLAMGVEHRIPLCAARLDCLAPTFPLCSCCCFCVAAWYIRRCGCSCLCLAPALQASGAEWGYNSPAVAV